MYVHFFKRILDFILALGGLIVLSPLFLIIAICIKLDSKGPVFFRQRRFGKNKKLFSIYKFRPMRDDSPHDMPTHLFVDANSYITRVGHFLRVTSLDELPQLINIIRGERSVVGPRPVLWSQTDLIAARDLYHANDVRPGLTGWAQINGRDELLLTEKVHLDGEYVQKISLAFDVRCFFRTFQYVIRRRGVREGGLGVPDNSLNNDIK